MSNLKRTATVRSEENTILARLDKKDFEAIQREFPQIFLNLKQEASKYSDKDMEFRRKFLKHVPYFRHQSNRVILDIMFLLKPLRFSPGQIIVNYGDIGRKLYFI